MVIERFEGNDMLPVYRRVRAEGRGLPDGLEYIGSWVEPGFSLCFQLMQCNDLRLLQTWVLHWHGTGVNFESCPWSRTARLATSWRLTWARHDPARDLHRGTCLNLHRAMCGIAGMSRTLVAAARGAYCGMALSHAQAGQAIDVEPLGARLAGAKTAALFKSDELEVMRLVLRAGKSLPPHKVPGEITIQCIEGRIDIIAEGRSHVLGPRQLMFLRGDVVHAVAALEDASALVTIVLKK